MTHTALILGASGKFGRNAALAFERAGWTVTRFDRTKDDLHKAIARADVTVNAMNPPDYTTWERDLLSIHARVIAAAKGTGTTLMLPGNVYNFAPDAPFGWSADTPQSPATALGKLRVQVEKLYRDSEVQTIVLRCGDFIDTQPGPNWFEGHIAIKATKGKFVYPGNPDIPHAWAYLPDAARAVVALAERRGRLAKFEDVPFDGWTLTGHELANATAQAIGRPLTLRKFPWGLLSLMAPFMPLIKQLKTVRYLWDIPQVLEGDKLARLIPEFQGTDPVTGLRQALAWQIAPNTVKAQLSLA